VQDVLDAVEFMKKQCPVDTTRLYVCGASGGGHMTLVMAGRAPELWAAASAWVPITDLAAWYRECMNRGLGYARNVTAVCGGKPGASPETDKQYRARSPVFLLPNAKGLPVDINAGIHDGHKGSVPISHSLHGFNVLADANGMPEKKLSDEQIRVFTDGERVPDDLASKPFTEEGRRSQVLFRRSAGPARITIFEGGHAGDTRAAIRWLAEHRRTDGPEAHQ
jgi:dienelactone hydrolase